MSPFPKNAKGIFRPSLKARVLVLSFAAAVFAHPATAAESPAWPLYAAGKYAEAISAGEAEGDAIGFAIAARAGLAAVTMSGQACLACIKHAESDARRAVALDPKLPDGHLLLAGALGYEGRIEGVMTARANGYPDQAKAQLDAALAAAPDNCLAIAAEGGWNIAIVSGGGKILARLIYGADLDTGLADFRKAFACAPDNLMLRYQYALTLGSYDPQRYRARIADALTRAITGKPVTAFESFAQVRAKELLAALNANDMKNFAKLVRRDQGYPN